MRIRLRRDEVGGLIWLLTVEWDGRTYRWSSQPVTLTNADGDLLCYDGGLDLSEWSQELEFLSTTPTEQTVSVSVDWPGLAARIETGRPLDTATAELAVMPLSGDWEDRLVLLAGPVDRPEYGADGEPASFSVVSGATRMSGVLPAPTLRVSEATWPALTWEPDEYGQWYPLVFGRPGYIDGTLVGRGSPAIVVDRLNLAPTEAQLVMVAGHPVDATTVAIIDSDLAATGALPIVTMVDGLGQTVSVVDISGSGAFIDLESQTFYAAWNTGAAMPGVVTAGDYLQWLIEQSGASVDVPRTLAACQRMPWIVDTYLDDSVDVLDLIEQITEVLPVSTAYGPDGRFPVVWNLDAREKDCVARLVAGAGLVREGRWLYDRSADDIISEVRCYHSVSAAGGKGTLHLLSAEGGDASSIHAEVAVSRYGIRPGEVTIPWTWRGAPAIAQAYLRARCSSLRRATYTGSLEEYGWLSPGDPVYLVDDEMSFEGVVLVTGVGIAGGECTLTLLILDNAEFLP